MYKVVGFPKTRAFRVIWMLEELEQPYEIDPVAPRSDEARAYNPSGKVPALVADGETICDSVAICQFLADRHGSLTQPAGTVARAHQDSWTQFAMDDVETPLWVNAKNTFILPERLRSQTAKDACKYDFDRAVKVFEARLANNTYVMGEQFTVPDVLLGHCASWAENGAGWTLPDGPVKDYADRVRSRPAHARAIAARDRFS
ncbi:MAG: glutathione S-transferase family protein [Pseudomonadota bacterium]